MLTARQVAYEILLRWHVPSDPPVIPQREDSWSGLLPRDRAFAFDLLTGIIRWRGTLDAIISSRLTRPLESLDHELHAALWIGAYQLLMHSGTADYAAVDTAVSLIRKSKGGAGLVNAVLRGITRLSPTVAPGEPNLLARNSFALDFTSRLTFNAPVLPLPSALNAHLAAARSHPRPYVEFLRKRFGDQTAGQLLLRNNLRPSITLRVDQDALDAPATARLQAHPEAKRFLIAAGGWNDSLAKLVKTGQLSPQDPTAAKPVRALAEFSPSPQHILDLCAGLGTKSLQLARTFPTAQITAADIDPAKLERLTKRAQQVRQPNITSHLLSSTTTNLPGAFDLILVDVPCSNTGVMARRVQSRWRWPTLDHAALHTLQLQLLTQGASLLAPTGILLYSTCSIDEAENQQLIQAFLKASPGWQITREEFTLPSLIPAQSHDGGYFVLLQRRPPPAPA